MINITLEQLINSAESLRSFAQKPLKARSAYAVAKILKQADAEMTQFNETRVELIKKYGELDENGEVITDENGNVRIPPENINAFNEELKELLKTSLDINANKLKITDLGDLEFTPLEMNQLEAFIDLEEDED